jgi:hypothetical protein
MERWDRAARCRKTLVLIGSAELWTYPAPGGQPFWERLAYVCPDGRTRRKFYVRLFGRVFAFGWLSGRKTAA